MTRPNPKLALACAAALAAAIAGGCTSSTITRMRPLQRVQYVVEEPVPATAPATAPAPSTEPATASAPSTEPAILATGSSTLPTTLAGTEPSTEPSTEPATQTASAPATQPSTQPLTVRVTKTKFVDPNQTAIFVFGGSYDKIWDASMALLVRDGFRIDRQDYRGGVLTTLPRPAAHLGEFWRPDYVGGKHALENTINTQRRSIRVTIKPVEGKEHFWEIAVQVLVERQDNPSEYLQAPVFTEGSGFGRNPLTLQTDFLEGPLAPGGTWRVEGHDVPAEKDVLADLRKHI